MANELTISRQANAVSKYLNEHGVGVSGTYFKFDGKAGGFVKSQDGELIVEGTPMAVIYEQVQVGWIKFNGKGQQPTRNMGPIFDGFTPPRRDTLGDDDPDKWELGLNGKPQDPWQFQILLPMQAIEDGELFVFQTSSLTGRRACDTVIRLCDRMSRQEPNLYPVVKLRVSQFKHKDTRVGIVKTPAFDRIGTVLKDGAAKVDLSTAADMDDEIPF